MHLLARWSLSLVVGLLVGILFFAVLSERSSLLDIGQSASRFSGLQTPSLIVTGGIIDCGILGILSGVFLTLWHRVNRSRITSTQFALTVAALTIMATMAVAVFKTWFWGFNPRVLK
jgi:hypothetical protein